MKSAFNSLKILANTKFLNMYEIAYTNKNGNKKLWTSVSRVGYEEYKNRLHSQKSKPDAVLIAAYHIEEKKIVLLKQYRAPLNKYIFEIPAGLIDNGEDIVSCSKRELLEETGLELVDIKKIYPEIYLSPGVTDESANFVFCTCKGDISYKHLEEDEDLMIHLFSKENIDIVLDECNDLKTLFAVSLFKNLGESFWD